nr:hypothetical protein [Tanacetum cinerariifolium]
MFLIIKRKKKYSGQDSLTGFKKRRLTYENYPKTRKLIDEFNLEEVFGENVKVCGYSRNEDVNQNVLNKEYIDVITIDVEVERVKNDVSKKKKDSSETKQDWLSIRMRRSPKVLYNLMKNLSPAQMKDIIDIGFGSTIGMDSEEIPGKIAQFVVDNFDDDSMKLKLLNGVISITPELVYKVLGVPLGGEDTNRMNRLGSEDVTTLEWHSQFSSKNPTPKKVYDKIQESQMGGILFKLNFLVLFSNAMGLSGKGGQCRPGKSINRYINEETKIELLDWYKYVCMCFKMSKINWIRDGENSYYSGPLTALTLMYLISTKCDSIFVPQERLAIKYWTTELIKKREIFEISNGGFGLLHLYSDDSSDDDIIKRELDSKMDKLDQKVTLLKLIVEDLEFEFSNCLMDHPNSSSHGVEELDNDFINETNEENREDSSEEEMIEENEEQMFVKGMHEEKEEEILNQDSIELNVLKVIEADNDKEKSPVCGFEDCLMKGLFRQDAEPDNSVRSFGNLFRVSTSDMPKHKLDEPPSFSLGPEFEDFSIDEINQTNVNDESRVAFSKTESHCSQKEKQSLDRIQTVFLELNQRLIEIVYSSCTNNVKIPRLFLESLATGLKIDEPVIDAWADLLNFSERYKSANSPSRYFFKPILLSVFDEYLSKNSPQRHASIFRNVEPERMKMIWRINENEFDSGVFLMSHMDNYFGLSETRILLSENNSYKDKFQKKVDKVISIDKNTRRELIGQILIQEQNVEPERMKMIWRINENEFDSGVFLMSHMDNYFGQSKSKWEYGCCNESKEQTKQLKFLRSKFAARILLSENNSYKDEFQKKVDKVRSIDNNTRRELIEKAILRTPAKLDEYFGIMKS